MDTYKYLISVSTVQHDNGNASIFYFYVWLSLPTNPFKKRNTKKGVFVLFSSIVEKLQKTFCCQILDQINKHVLLYSSE